MLLQVKKQFCLKNCFDLSLFEFFANSCPSVSNFKSFSYSLEHFFLKVGQNNFGNKILFHLILKIIDCHHFNNIKRNAALQWMLSKCLYSIMSCCIARTTDAQWSLFSVISQTFGLEQTNRADKFWGIFDQTISTHFGTVSSLSMLSI